MKRTSIWARAATAVLVAGMAFALAWASPASAQSTLTPEGTEITNTATVSYTDANGNEYDDVEASVTVTVGFLAGIDVERGAESVSVQPGSSGNEITFTITNLSNGPTGIDLALTNAAPVVATDVTYIYNSNPYATLDLLEAAIGEMAQGASVVVTVVFNAAAGSGGVTDNLELAATTVRSTTGGGTASDEDDTDIVSLLEGDVTVTPDNEPVGQLPSNGTNYTATFTVTNGQGGTDTFDLESSISGGNTAGLVIVKMYYCNGDPNTNAITTVTLAAGASRDICVEYSVADNAAGSTGTIVLTATSQASATVNDTGSYDVTIIRPALQVIKQAFLEQVVDNDSTMSSTEVGATLVLPGQYIWYRIEVKNVGTSSASTVELTDQLPSQVEYVSHTDDGGTPAWTYTDAVFATGLVKAQLTGILAPESPATEVVRWIAVRVLIK